MITHFTSKNPDGSYSHSFLSNFYDSPFTYKGVGYPTLEHYYQAQKAVDDKDRLRIATAPTAGAAKKMGRTVDLRPDWEAVKLAVMRVGLRHKFAEGSTFADRLLATGDEVLVEGNDWGDRYWGQVNGEGQNWLGHLLMARRAELRGV